MTSIERKNEQRKLNEMYYYGDFIEDDKEFYYEESYIDAYLIENEVITGNFY